MDPKLRDLIYNSKLHQGVMPEISRLLPEDDAELDALVAEAVASHESDLLMFILLGAMTAGRPVDSRHLEGGMPLLGHEDWVCCIAWKMKGEVAQHLVGALRKTVMTREQAAAALLIAAAWSIEFRDGKLPPEYIGLARVMARSTDDNPTQIGFLWAICEMLKDPDLAAVMRTAHPRLSNPAMISKSVAYGASALAICRTDLMELIPLKPTNLIGSGPNVRRAVARIGRNDPCPCGSGQKYKRCCAAKDQERMRHSSNVEGKTRAEVMAEPELHLTGPALKTMPAYEVARLDLEKLPSELLPAYMQALENGLLMEETAAVFEKLGCGTKEMEEGWDMLIQTVSSWERLDIARRMVKARYKDGPVPDTLYFRARLLLASEEPEHFWKLVNEQARVALTSNDDGVLMEFAHGLLLSPSAAVGIHCARSLIPVMGKKLASKLLNRVEITRDRLNLPPEEPFGEILDKRFAEEVAGGGKDAEALRKALRRVEGKAAEVNQLKESLEKFKREIRLQEKKAPAAATTQAPAETPELRDLREKVRELKSSINERNNERAAYRRELGETYAELEALRAKQSAASPAPAADAIDAEDALLLSGDIESNQPPRPIEFPRRFNDTLAQLPRQVGRAALIHIGRIAAGDPTAFAGAIRLKAAPDVMRVRIGQDHRMLFRLLPESVQLVDLINRRDLERCIALL